MESDMAAVPMASATHEDLAKELTCSICRGLFQEPVLLHCGHSFCQNCIDAACGGQPRSTCPVCSAPFEKGKFTGVMALANIVERVKSVGPSRQIPGRSSKELCPDHKERMKFYCKDDGELVCVICRDSLKHANHCFLPIQYAVGMYKEQLRAAMKPLKSFVAKCQDVEKAKESTSKSRQADAAQAIGRLVSAFETIHQALKVKETEMMMALLCEEKTTQKEMGEHLTKIKADTARIDQTVEAAQAWLKEADPLDFLADIKACLKRCSEEDAKCTSATDQPPKRKSKGPIEYIIWRELKSVFCPAFSQITLDPKTADHSLAVSNDRTSVLYSGEVPHPTWFSQIPAVLGSEGFTSGRRYWEVDVGTRSSWILGVAKESSFFRDCSQLGPSNGVWALKRKQSNSYEALDNPPKTLAFEFQSRVIGVYLDFESALVSFYDADRMAPLHTFSGIPSVKLFPYFCPSADISSGKSDPLTICH